MEDEQLSNQSRKREKQAQEQSPEAKEEELVFPDNYFHFDKAGLMEDYNKILADIQTAYELGNEVVLPEIKGAFDHIFFIGMGGSAISADFLKKYLEHIGIAIPITIIRDYTMPPTFTESSLVIGISYSGNTEETLSAFRLAMRKSKYCFAYANGGKLQEACAINRTPCTIVPKGYQPRTAALTYLFFPILRLLERLQIVPSQQGEVDTILQTIKKTEFKPIAINLSEKLINTIPLIYATAKYFPVAFRFKTQVNENTKRHAFAGEYSEFNHNEILGYEHVNGTYHIITYRFNDDHRRLHKRMDIVKEITNKAGVETTEIKLSGESYLAKVFSAVLIGDLTSYYLALRYKLDPSPVHIIESLKEKMGPLI
ncbi:bifunctional phosphoglucose/phosphomannose isomerase [Candidatus Woesearchaeota archaeon]|nr:bifunctional phosphoglucose/phosphomannose isomerase [Candidatus Woesearchaeota archaeon]